MFSRSVSRNLHRGLTRRWMLVGLVTAVLVSMLPLAVQAAFQVEAIINDGGADLGEPGLEIHYANGELQVVRDGEYQLATDGQTPFNPPDTTIDNAIALTVGSVGYSPPNNLIHDTSFTDATQTGGSVAGNGGSITGTLDTGVGGVDIDVSIDYVYPNDYFTVSLDVNRAAPTAEVKLYHFVRPWFVSTDTGAGFFTAGPHTVGAEGATRSQAFRYESGPAWTGYFTGSYNIPHVGIEASSNFPNTVDAGPGTTQWYGIMWNLGTAAGTQTVSYRMMFGDIPVAPDQMVAPTAVGGNTNATVTITPPNDNGSTITGYTVTSNPGGLTCTITPPATACVVTGLTNGTPYTFTATAENAGGTSTASTASNSVTPIAPVAGPGPAPAPDPAGPVFIDIPAGEMADAASWLAARGIALGCVGGESPQFCPFELATRAEVATFLSRALELPATAVDAFTDDDGHLLEEHLNRASVAGVFLGCSPDRLVCPDDDITRGELAAVLVRAFALSTSTPTTFSDADQHWSQSFIGIMGGLGISIGCTSDGENFCPEGFGTRGEIALFLYRTMNLE